MMVKSGIGRAFGGLLRGLMLGGAAALLSGCGLFGGPSEEFRYRLTVEVETPGGMKSGSSVIEVRAVKNSDWLTPEARGHRYSFKGEAVAVDLPGGRTLFALLKMDAGGDNVDEIPWHVFADRIADTRDPLEQMRIMRAWKDTAQGGIVVPPTRQEYYYKNGKRIDRAVSNYPMLVTFTDIADPKSVARVEPDNLTAAFGPGVTLKRITVQVTDDEVTKGIEKRLGWLDHLEDYRTDRKNPFTGTLPREIGGLRSK